MNIFGVKLGLENSFVYARSTGELLSQNTCARKHERLGLSPLAIFMQCAHMAHRYLQDRLSLMSSENVGSMKLRFMQLHLRHQEKGLVGSSFWNSNTKVFILPVQIGIPKIVHLCCQA